MWSLPSQRVSHISGRCGPLWGGEKSEGVSLLEGTTVAAVKQNIGIVVVRGHARCFILLKWLTGMWLRLKPKISRSRRNVTVGLHKSTHTIRQNSSHLFYCRGTQNISKLIK